MGAFWEFENSVFIDGKENVSSIPYIISSFRITDGVTLNDTVGDDDGIIITTITIEDTVQVPFRTGIDGRSSYIAYASDENGTDFSLSPASSLNYVAFLNSQQHIDNPTVEDFDGLWERYKGESAFELWQENNPGGTFEEYEQWQRQPATDAAESIAQLEEDIEEVEAQRALKEEDRVLAE